MRVKQTGIIVTIFDKQGTNTFTLQSTSLTQTDIVLKYTVQVT